MYNSFQKIYTSLQHSAIELLRKALVQKAMYVAWCVEREVRSAVPQSVCKARVVTHTYLNSI